MVKRSARGILLGLLITIVIVVPVLANYYAYIYVDESDGNSYTNLPLICSANITQLVNAKFISSTGLDTRVLTGEGYALPHMLASDKIMFVSDLEANEDKTLIFYTRATSLSDFPIIVGYDGYITTPDDEDLELTYVMELLASGYFDASAGSDKNILYKEDAFRVWISGANRLEVSGLESGGGEEWEMTYSSFTSGTHTVYILSNGLGAYLYVDDFEVAKDTENLYEASNALLSTADYQWAYPYRRNTCYAEDKYWAFYGKGNNNVYWRTSVDGLSWCGEKSVAGVVADNVYMIDVFERGGDVHIVYTNGNNEEVRYRRGTLNADDTITWAAVWQTVVTVGAQIWGASIAVDTNSYPFVVYTDKSVTNKYENFVTKSSTNDGTWATAGSYPLKLSGTWNGGAGEAIVSYLSSNKIYALYTIVNTLYGRYYNGTAWTSGEVLATGTGYNYFNGVSDEDDNVYMVWSELGNDVYFKIRYADGTFSDTTQLVDTAEPTYPSVAYNDANGYVYIIYMRGGSVRCITLAAGTFTGEYTLFNPVGPNRMAAATPYGNHIGLLYTTGAGGDTEHGFLQFPWEWDDNANNWTWMENNVMSYADYFIMATDGVTHLHYQPATIIQGTTLPDISEASDNDGIITWGSNPDGVDTSISGLQSEDNGEAGYYYPYLEPGSQDIISPEPAGLISGVDLERLEHNPFHPLVEGIVAISNGQLTESLVWIIWAWFITIAAYIGTFILMRQHIIWAGLVGEGLSILFYTMGIFDYWVLILFALGIIAGIVQERMPTW